MSPADTEKESQSENRWDFRRLRNVAEESASLIVCGRAFENLGAELQKALKPGVFFGSTWNLKACLRWWAKGSCRNMSRNEFLQVLRRCTFVALSPPLKCGMHICMLFVPSAFWSLLKALILSVSIVRLGRNSVTIGSFIVLLHWAPVATDRIVRLSLMVDRGLKTQSWLVILMGFLDSHIKYESM